jgi:hypothetical protein
MLFTLTSQILRECVRDDFFQCSCNTGHFEPLIVAHDSKSKLEGVKKADEDA